MNTIKSRNEKIFALKQIINTNFAASYFIPVSLNGNKADALFLYSSAVISARKTRPFAKALFDHSSGALLEYTNSYITDFMDPEKHPMTEQISYELPGQFSAAEQGAMIRKVNDLYDVVFSLAFSTELSQQDKAKLLDYKDCFYKSTPQALLPFYYALSPEFFEWLNNI